MGKKALIQDEWGVGGPSKLLCAQALQEGVHMEAEGMRTITLPSHMHAAGHSSSKIYTKADFWSTTMGGP